MDGGYRPVGTRYLWSLLIVPDMITVLPDASSARGVFVLIQFELAQRV